LTPLFVIDPYPCILLPAFGPIVAILSTFNTSYKEATMNALCRLSAIAISIVFVLSCGSNNPAPKAKDTPQGRAETKSVEGATAVGYNGSQMRKKIDKVLDQNDERNKEIEKGAGAAASK
jgi:hypothetical protein